MITTDQLQKILSNTSGIDQYVIALNLVLPKFEINTRLRIAHFISQTAHESLDYRILTENLNYTSERLRQVFAKYFLTDAVAREYNRKPELIANRIYANRMGNGPESTGDGYKFCGRGLIQLTGRTNYQLFAFDNNLELDQVPAYLVTPLGAVTSAAWYWHQNNLNQLADKNDIQSITRKINGGLIGLDDRQNKLKLALSQL